MRKIGVFILILLLCISASVTAYAEIEPMVTERIVFNELEYIAALRTEGQGEQHSVELYSLYSESIDSDCVEQELLHRKSLSDEILSAGYGYTDEQIAILRNYEGTPIEDTPEILALGAELTLRTPEVLACSAFGIELYVEWEWDSKPLIRQNDAIAMYWRPTFGSQNGTLRMIHERSFVDVEYINSDNLGYNYSVINFSNEALGEASKAVFPMMYGGQNSTKFWAHSGSAFMDLEISEGSANLTSVDVEISYGHSTIAVTPSISYPFSGGISWEGTTTESGEQVGYINISNGIWNRN